MVKRKLNITEEQKKKCHTIIHTHAGMCGGVGTGMAQIPLADNAVITPIQIAMIIELGLVFDQKIGKAVAQSILSGASASLVGRGITQVLWGWIPFVGNAINTATAAGLTEAIGWMAVDRFSKEKFYDESIENDTENKITDETISQNDEEVIEREKEIEILKVEASKFFSGEKSYIADKTDYDELITRFETILRGLPAEHELRDTYKELTDLLWK